MLAVTLEFDPPVTAICVTVREELASESVSSATNNSEPELSVIVAFSSIASVSLTATGASLIPVTVMINVAVSVAVPSETVYVNTSVPAFEPAT